jgi:5'-nucleotidase
MEILLTNDDGINSEGLWAIAETLKNIGKVTIVVPDRDQSGTGASMSLLKPLTVEKVAPKITKIEDVYTVDGTPADCVIMANELLIKSPIDLVVSGINQGANLGLDILNSGTFGAALHGYFRNINSMAVSVKYDAKGVINFPSAKIGASIAEKILNNQWDHKMLLNINCPPCEMDQIEGIETTTLASKAYLESVQAIQNGRRTNYWLRHTNVAKEQPLNGSDVDAINRNCVSITSINPFMKDRNALIEDQNIIQDLKKMFLTEL